jgi:hypothetical protein
MLNPMEPFTHCKSCLRGNLPRFSQTVLQSRELAVIGPSGVRIERTRSPMNYVHRKPGSFFNQLRFAVPTGFETSTRNY